MYMYFIGFRSFVSQNSMQYESSQALSCELSCRGGNASSCFQSSGARGQLCGQQSAGLTVMPSTAPQWLSNHRRSLPLRASHMPMIESAPPVKSRRVRASYSSDVTGPVWPRRVRSARPAAVDHRIACLSIAPLHTKHSPPFRRSSADRSTSDSSD